MPKVQLSSRLWIALALFVLVVGGGIWVWTLLEWTEKEIDKGYSKQAQRNDYLAATLFLERFGVDTKATYQRTVLDKLALPDSGARAKAEEQEIVEGVANDNDTMVFINGRGTLRGERFEKTWAWIQRGGTLVYSVQNPFIGTSDREDQLLETLGVYYWDSERDSVEETATSNDEESNTEDIVGEGADEDTDSEADVFTDALSGFLEAKKDPCLAYELAEVPVSGFEAPLMIDLTGTTDVDIDGGSDFSPEALVYRHDRFVFAQFAVGDGTVYISVDNEIWKNTRIHCFDHAALLTQLVNQDGKVWFLINNDSPSLLAVFWRNAPLLVILLPVLILLWLWNQAPRFGPFFVEKTIQRRSFSEHLNASANFLWKNKQYGLLIERLRQELISDIRLRIAHYDDLDETHIADALSQLTGLKKEVISLALFKPTETIYTDFADVIAKLKTIKETL